MSNNFNRIRSRSLSNIKHTADSAAIKSTSDTKHQVNNNKKISFQKLLDEAKYTDSGEEFTKKLLQTFYGQYKGADEHVLTPIVRSLSTDTTTDNLFNLPKLTAELQQALAIGYIKDFEIMAVDSNGKFNFNNFKQWCKNNFKTEVFKNNETHKKFIEQLDAVNFQNIKINNKIITFIPVGTANTYNLDELTLNPKLAINNLTTLTNYQLQKVFTNREISNLMLTQMECDPKFPLHIKTIIRTEMTHRLENELAKTTYDNNVKTKIKDCFNNKLTSLNLSNMLLTDIPSNNLLILLPHLTTIDLSSNEIYELNQNSFINLPNLRKLNLDKNHIHVLPTNLIGLNKLQYLNLSNNLIEDLPETIFAGLNNLKELNLSNNSIYGLPQTSFAELSNLTKLKLNNNLIDKLPDAIFAGLNNLKVCNLSHNSIRKLTKNSVAELSNLELLDLSYNEIKNLHEETFVGLHNLEELNLSNNKIQSLPAKIFVELSNLIELYLNNNLIESVFENSCVGLHNLGILDLSHNSLALLPDKLLTTLKSLERLSLNYNRLTNLPDTLLHELNNLHTLKLQDNLLTEINASWFNLPQLERLDLSTNRMTQIHGEFKCPRLIYLNLGVNKLSVITPDLLMQLKSLQYLNLDFNKITNLAPHIFSGLLLLREITAIKNPAKLTIETFDPLLCQIYSAEPYSQYISEMKQSIHINLRQFQEKLFSEYTSNDIDNLAENYCLALLLNNILDERTVKSKLAMRLFSGAIGIKNTQKNLAFFVRLVQHTEIPLLKLLGNNLDYFTRNEEGISEVLQTLANEILITPPSLKQIDDLIKDEFINKVTQLVAHNVNHNTIYQNIIQPLKEKKVKPLINQIIIKTIREQYINYPQIPQINKITDEQLSTIINRMWRTIPKPNNSDVFSKNMNIKEINKKRFIVILKQTLSLQDIVDENTIVEINQFAENLLTQVDIYGIQKEYVTTKYANTLGINHTKYNEFYEVFTEYLDWNQTIAKSKEKSLSHINQQIMREEFIFRRFLEENLTTKAPEIYESYILNVLPYLTLTNIKIIGEDNVTAKILPDIVKLVKQCTQQINYANQDSCINMFVVTEKATQKKQLLMLQDLYYLNNQNTNDFELKQLSLLEPDINNKEDKFILQSLTYENLEKILFPDFLLSLINNHLSVGNRIAKKIDKFITQLINFKEFQLPPKQREELSKICYEMTLRINEPLSIIPTESKQQIMSAFKDDPEFITDKGNIQEIYCSMGDIDPKNEQNAEAYSKALLEKASAADNESKLPFKVLEELLESVYNDLSKLADLSDNLLRAEVDYLLGVILLNMSSVNVLGYEIKKENGWKENKAFTWSRLLGALCLAKSLREPDSDWTESAKEELNSIVHQIINTGECSGSLVYYLYDEGLVKEELLTISQRVNTIINTQLNQANSQ